MERKKQELAFIDQKTRQRLVDWADVCVMKGSLPEHTFHLESENPYVRHAFAKGWLTKRTPRRLTSDGFSVATSFLRR